MGLPAVQETSLWQQKKEAFLSNMPVKAAAFLSNIGYKILRGLLILIRIGQVATAAIVSLIFFYMVYQTKTHYCFYSPWMWQCKSHPDLVKVPISFVLVLVATLASGAQLIILTLYRVEKAASRSKSNSKPGQLNRHSYFYGFLLTPSDILIFILYLVAFIYLSEYVVPTRILRGSLSGTGCWFDNHYDRYISVILQECVLGQHGYWWCMGAMISYLVTSLFYIVVRIEASIAKRAGKNDYTIDGVLVEDDRSTPGSTLERTPLLSDEDDSNDTN